MCIICESEIEDNGYQKLQGLTELSCEKCPNLTSIPEIQGLEKLSCYNCPKLTSILEIQGMEYLDCRLCPWIPNQNDEYKSNIEKLITIQRLFKKWLPFRRLRSWIKSRDFAEWYYHPERPGGRISKRIIERFLDLNKINGKD